MTSFAEWEAKAHISAVSPESAYAEDAWNAAITAAQGKLLELGHEDSAAAISGLDTGFRVKYPE